MYSPVQSSTHLQHLYSDVPKSYRDWEIMGKDVSQLSEKELEALILTTRAQRVAPSERKKTKTVAAKVLSGKTKKVDTDLSHLL